jgi:hypothetical protein
MDSDSESSHTQSSSHNDYYNNQNYHSSSKDRFLSHDHGAAAYVGDVSARDASLVARGGSTWAEKAASLASGVHSYGRGGGLRDAPGD